MVEYCTSVPHLDWRIEGTTIGPPAKVNCNLTVRANYGETAAQIPGNTRFLSLFELSEACDVPVRRSCRTGVRHSCESL